MMRRKLLHRIDGYVWSYQSYDARTKVYDATSHMMTEVGRGASHTMTVCGATESILITGNLTISVVIDTRRYISRQKLLHKMKLSVIRWTN